MVRFTKGKPVFEIFCSSGIVVISNRWCSLFVKVCLKIGKEGTKNNDLGKERRQKMSI